VISGRRRRMIGPDGTPHTVGYRIVKGGGAFVWPVFEKAEILSLELLTLDIKLPEVYTTTGVPVVVDGVAQIKVKGEDISIATAAEQFLSKSRGEVMPIAHQTLEGHLRAILGIMTVEDLYKNREVFAQRVQEVAATAQLPEVLKTLSGVDITQWLQHIPGPRQKTSARAEP
jgi:flotillin